MRMAHFWDGSSFFPLASFPFLLSFVFSILIFWLGGGWTTNLVGVKRQGTMNGKPYDLQSQLNHPDV
jgi:hypothetical protein